MRPCGHARFTWLVRGRARNQAHALSTLLLLPRLASLALRPCSEISPSTTPVSFCLHLNMLQVPLRLPSPPALNMLQLPPISPLLPSCSSQCLISHPCSHQVRKQRATVISLSLLIPTCYWLSSTLKAASRYLSNPHPAFTATLQSLTLRIHIITVVCWPLSLSLPFCSNTFLHVDAGMIYKVKVHSCSSLA